jgi:hypothetical protein
LSLEREAKTRAAALEHAAITAPPGENMINTIRRAHYFAHWLETGGRSQIACPDRCPYKEPSFPDGISILK